MVTQLVRLY